MFIKKTITAVLIAASTQALAIDPDYRYQAIEKRYGNAALKDSTVKNAKMQGECLVGLKNVNFKKANSFDAVAEWTSYRSVSLLEQYSPCEVLIMMETAKVKLQS